MLAYLFSGVTISTLTSNVVDMVSLSVSVLCKIKGSNVGAARSQELFIETMSKRTQKGHETG